MGTKIVTPPLGFNLDLPEIVLLAGAVLSFCGLLWSLDRAGLLTWALVQAMLGGAVGVWLAVTLFRAVMSLLPRGGGKGQAATSRPALG